jgi:hypothetical protein
MALGAWKEKRTLTIAIIGFSFIMAEISAGTWVPIALTVSGFSGSAAAFAFGMLWIVVTFGRLIGGFVVEKIGRYRTVLAVHLDYRIRNLDFHAGGSHRVALRGARVVGAWNVHGLPHVGCGDER